MKFTSDELIEMVEQVQRNALFGDNEGGRYHFNCGVRTACASMIALIYTTEFEFSELEKKHLGVQNDGTDT